MNRPVDDPQALGARLARRAMRARALWLDSTGGPMGTFYRLVLLRAERKLREHIDEHGIVRCGRWRFDPGPEPETVRAWQGIRMSLGFGTHPKEGR